MILCDRGLLDGSAYVSPLVWETVLRRMGYNQQDLSEDRYNAVIHMVTAAEGAEKFYSQCNEARYESVV